MSDLEREFELDMESEPPEEEAFETDLDEELEADLDEEYGEEEGPEDLEQEFEVLAEALEQDEDPREREFAERFYELGQREFKSELEVDRALTGVLNEMEREYFFGRLVKGVKRLGKSKLVSALVRKGRAGQSHPPRPVRFKRRRTFKPRADRRRRSHGCAAPGRPSGLCAARRVPCGTRVRGARRSTIGPTHDHLAA